jgi:hypothetical protein
MAKKSRGTSRAVISRRTVELEGGEKCSVEFNCAESPLAWLRTRKDAANNALITDEQYCAGLRLGSDFAASRLLPTITTNWQSPLSPDASRRAPPRDDLLHQTEKMLAAKQRYYRALEAVGPELSPMLVEICCHTTGIEAAEQLLGMPRRSGKVVLQLGLTRLARFYGLISDPKASRRAPIQSCAVPGYRPRIC